MALPRIAPRTALRVVMVAAAAGLFGYEAWQRKHVADPAHETRGELLIEGLHDEPSRLGSLAWKPCTLRKDAATPRPSSARDRDEPRILCSTLSVPERRDRPEGPHIELKLALVEASEVAERDLVVFIAGGPGQAATETFDAVAAAFGPLLEHHHVLLVDQRGTGGSHPLRCDRDENDVEQSSLDLARVKARTVACRDKLSAGTDLSRYTTSDAVEDLEAVRQAVGAPQLDLVGISYGTRMAQQYLVHHPEGVRSVVLDGVVPNEERLGEHMGREIDNALRMGSAACVADAACKKRFGDPYATLRRAQARLVTQPASVTFRDSVTFAERTRPFGALGLVGLARLFAYATETQALLPLLVDEADHGRYGPIVALLSTEDDPLGSMYEGMSMSVLCGEDVPLITPDPADSTRLLGGDVAATLKAQCEVWPHGTPPDGFHAPLHSDKPVLLLSGERDPVTPPAYAEAVKKGLTRARHLVGKGQGHSLLGRGCVPKLVARFVDRLDPTGLDAACVDDRRCRYAASPARGRRTSCRFP